MLKDKAYIVRINDPRKHTFIVDSAELEGLIKHLGKIGKQINPKDGKADTEPMHLNLLTARPVYSR